MVAEVEPGCDALFGRHEAELLEPRDLSRERRLERQIRQCWAAPEVECLVEHVERGLGLVAIVARFLQELFETERVEILWIGPEAIAGRMALDPLGSEPSA